VILQELAKTGNPWQETSFHQKRHAVKCRLFGIVVQSTYSHADLMNILRRYMACYKRITYVGRMAEGEGSKGSQKLLIRNNQVAWNGVC
jgi:hypothetical protein